jgi:hypothetical protein
MLRSNGANRPTLFLGVLTLAAACSIGGEAAPPMATGPTSPTTPVTSEPSVAPPTTPVTSLRAAPSPARPAAIHVRGLPEQGLAVEDGDAVELYDLFTGTLVVRLEGFSIYRYTDAPGNLVLVHRGTYYLLEEFERVLRPLPSRRAADRRQGSEDNEPDLPIPESNGQPMLGHWRYSANDPHYGDRVLAQWSGECEAPIAFFVEKDEGDIEPITGEDDPANAPDSIGLGWTKVGQAVVLLREGTCSGGTDPPGVYLFRTAGHGRLLVETPPWSGARMWGTMVAG